MWNVVETFEVRLIFASSYMTCFFCFSTVEMSSIRDPFVMLGILLWIFLKIWSVLSICRYDYSALDKSSYMIFANTFPIPAIRSSLGTSIFLMLSALNSNLLSFNSFGSFVFTGYSSRSVILFAAIFTLFLAVSTLLIHLTIVFLFSTSWFCSFPIVLWSHLWSHVFLSLCPH
jgi:hypothetical protein